MPRIAGVNIPEKKPIEISLTYIYGIGLSLARKILAQVGIDPKKKANQLTAQELNVLKETIEKNYKVEGDLKREKLMRIKFLKDIGCWRGLRHLKGLPVRGQTTRRNSRTIRGNVRRTVTSGRRPPPSPT
jgi:small subunit ribosomal protein S13